MNRERRSRPLAHCPGVGSVALLGRAIGWGSLLARGSVIIVACVGRDISMENHLSPILVNIAKYERFMQMHTLICSAP